MIDHFEFTTGMSSPLALPRWEGDQASGTTGIQIWYWPFSLSVAAMLITSGHLLIRHKGILINGSDSYPIYANARIALFSAATPDLLPPVGTPPQPWDNPATIIAGCGGNINGVAEHYFNADLTAQKLLIPAAYRVEVWASSGSSSGPGMDGLGELPNYNQWIWQQFNGMLLSL